MWAPALARLVGARLWLGGVVAVLSVVSDAGARPGTRTQITIWAPAPASYGGAGYGFASTTGAMISEQREVEIGPNGEVRIANVASTADPASVQLRDLTEPGVTITEQRFLPGATTPTEMIARRLGEQITVITTKGDVSGVLRAVDEHTLVVEVGSGDARRVSVMRRDGYVLDVRLGGAASDKPSLVWRVATKKPGRHAIELSYRATGMTWSADYLAVLDEPGKHLDFSAWATIKNATGATFDNTDVTLVSGEATGTTFARPAPVPIRFSLPQPVRLSARDSVQVELVPSRVAARVRPIITYEAMPDPVPSQSGPNFDCTAYNGIGMGTGRAEIAMELDVPSQHPLPEGRVRLFRRRGARLEVVSEDQLRSAAGFARIRLAPDADITGERHAVTCNADERAHTIHEKIEVKIENKGAQPTEVVVREFMWRTPVWRLENEDRKGIRAASQTQEYRVRVAAKSSQTVTYTAVYSW